MENVEKVYYVTSPAPEVSLLDWYLCSVNYLISELRKYTEVEIIDEYGILEHFNEGRKMIGYSTETDEALKHNIAIKTELNYKIICSEYCPELTYEEFISKSNKWLPEELKKYCIQTYKERN